MFFRNKEMLEENGRTVNVIKRPLAKMLPQYFDSILKQKIYEKYIFKFD